MRQPYVSVIIGRELLTCDSVANLPMELRMLLTLLRLVLNKDARKKIANLKNSVTEYAVAEFEYTAAVAQVGLENIMSLLLFGVVLGAATFGFFVMLMLTIAFALLELMPSLTQGGAFAIVSVLMAGGLALLFVALKRQSVLLKNLLSQYINHWNTSHES